MKRHTPRIDYTTTHHHEHGDPTWICLECGMPVGFRWRKWAKPEAGKTGRDTLVHLR